VPTRMARSIRILYLKPSRRREAVQTMHAVRSLSTVRASSSLNVQWNANIRLHARVKKNQADKLSHLRQPTTITSEGRGPECICLPPLAHLTREQGDRNLEKYRLSVSLPSGGQVRRRQWHGPARWSRAKRSWLGPGAGMGPATGQRPQAEPHGAVGAPTCESYGLLHGRHANVRPSGELLFAFPASRHHAVYLLRDLTNGE